MQIATYALCTLEDVKDYIETNEALDDNSLTEWINAVSSDCESFCGRKFLKRTYTGEKYDGDGTRTLLLKNYPIDAVSSLVIEDNGAALAADEYYIYPNSGRVVLESSLFAKSNQKVVITYDAGFDGLANLPAELRRSVVLGVTHKYNEQTNKTLGRTSVSFQGGEQVITRIDSEYPKSVIRWWQRYRRSAFYVDDEGQ